MGGREMLTPTFTSAVVGTGNANTNAKSIVVTRNFFIFSPHCFRYDRCRIRRSDYFPKTFLTWPIFS